MQRLLLYRTFRDLKANFFRYFSLFSLVFLAMFLIVALIGAATSIIETVDECATKNNLEDGQFGVFLPLTHKQIKKLEDNGISLEKSFYIDFSASDNSTVRVMKVREKINKIEVSKGTLPTANDEIALERLYASAHKLDIGDTIVLAQKTFRVCAIVTTPDYDSCLQNMADMSSDGNVFGTSFVTKDAYNALLKTGKALHAEEYRYSYKRKNSSAYSDNELKEALLDFKIKADEIDDPYFTEEVEEQLEDRDDVQDGISELVDGANELSDALDKLDSGTGDLKDGMQTIYEELEKLNEQATSLSKTSSNMLASLEESDSALASSYFHFDSSLHSFTTTLSGLYSGYESLMDGADELKDGTGKLSDSGVEFRDGVVELQEESDTMLDDYFSLEIGNLSDFVSADDNPRIKAASDDVQININVGFIAGVIILVLITYVISIFIIHSIDQESAMIGALYALGLKKRELTFHYTMLPVVLCFVGGFLGTVLGYSKIGISFMADSSYAYYSIPDIVTHVSPLLLLYGVIMPPAVALFVNRIIINKRLSRTALSLLRKEQKLEAVKMPALHTKSFIRTFQIRQFLREKRSCIAVIASIFVSLLVLVIGIDCYILCNDMRVKNVADTKYNYMYNYKYPTDFPPKGGTEAYVEGLTKEVNGYDMELSIIGLTKDNPFFPTIKSKAKSEISISSSVASKFDLEVGDELILRDKVKEKLYGFTVKEIISYSPGLCCFMNIDSMRELFEQEDDYYNVVYCSKQLDIDNGRLYSISKKEDVEKSASIFLELMMPMLVLIFVASIGLFLIVLYQMMKVMIDRSSFSISLMKVFGYKDNEIRKLYLDGNFLLIAISSPFVILLSKLFIDLVFPLFVANVACGVDISWSLWIYVAVYVGILVSYWIIQIFLTKKISKLSAAEVLKDRE